MGLQFTMEDQPDQTIPEDTIVRATLMEIKQHDFEWTDYKQNPPVQKQSSVLQWWWEVKAPDAYVGRRVKGECDTKLGNNSRNRFSQWATALLDREIPIGMTIDVDDLVGLSADISIRHDRDKKDPSKRYERVDEVMPVSGGTSTDWGTPPF
jgi:hypothetical protein